MKKLFVLIAFALCISALSFGADVGGHSVKTAGKQTYKAAKASLKDAAGAGKAAVKFMI